MCDVCLVVGIVLDAVKCKDGMLVMTQPICDSIRKIKEKRLIDNKFDQASEEARRQSFNYCKRDKK